MSQNGALGKFCLPSPQKAGQSPFQNSMEKKANNNKNTVMYIYIYIYFIFYSVYILFSPEVSDSISRTGRPPPPASLWLSAPLPYLALLGIPLPCNAQYLCPQTIILTSPFACATPAPCMGFTGPLPSSQSRPNNMSTLKSSPDHIFRAIFTVKTLPLDQQLRITDLGHPDVLDDLKNLGVIERTHIAFTLSDWIPAHPLLLDDLRRLVSIFHLQNALPGTTNSINRTTIALTAFPGELTEYCLNLFERLGWAIRMVNTWQLTEVGRTLATEFLAGANFVWPDAATRNATPTLLDTLLLLPYAGAPAHVIHQCYKSASPIVDTIAGLDDLVKKGLVGRDKALTHTLTTAGRTKALEEYPTPPLAFPILAPLPASAFAPHIIPCVPDITKPHPDAPPKPLVDADYQVLGVFLSFTTLSDGQVLPSRSSHTSHNAAMRTPGGGYKDSLDRVIFLTDRGYLKRGEGLGALYSITEKGEAALKDWKAKNGASKTPSDASSPSTPAQSTPAPEKPVSDELAKTVRRLGGRVSRLESEVDQIKKDVNTASVCVDPPDETPAKRLKAIGDHLVKELKQMKPGFQSTPASAKAWCFSRDPSVSVVDIIEAARAHPDLVLHSPAHSPGELMIQLVVPGVPIPWPDAHTTPGARIVRYLTKSLDDNPSLSDHWITTAQVVVQLFGDDWVKPSFAEVLASARCHPALRVFTDPKYPCTDLIALRNPRPAQYAEQFGNAVKISGLVGEKKCAEVEENELCGRVNDILWKQAYKDYSDILAGHGAPFPGKRHVTMPLELVNLRLDRPASGVGELKRILRRRGYHFPAFPMEYHVGFDQMKSALDVEKHITGCLEKLFAPAHYWSLPLARVANEVGVSEKALRFVLNLHLSTDWVFSEMGAVDLAGRTTAYVSRRAKGPAESPKPSDSPNQEGKWVCAVDQKEVEKKILWLLRQQYIDTYTNNEKLRLPWDNRECRVSVQSLANQSGVPAKDVLSATAASKVLCWHAVPTGPVVGAARWVRLADGFVGFIKVPPVSQIHYWIVEKAEEVLSTQPNRCGRLEEVAAAVGVTVDTLRIRVRDNIRFYVWEAITGTRSIPMIQLEGPRSDIPQKPAVNTTPPKPIRQRTLMEKVVQWLKDNTRADKPFHTTSGIATGMFKEPTVEDNRSVLRVLEKAARARNGVQVRLIGLDGRQTLEWTWGPALAALRKQTRDVRCGIAHLLSAYPKEWFSVAEIADKAGHSVVQIERALNLRRHDFPVTTIAGAKTTKPTLYKWNLKQGGAK